MRVVLIAIVCFTAMISSHHANAADAVPLRLSSSDVRAMLTAVGQFDASAATKFERNEAKQIALSADAMIFLRAEGLDCEAALKRLIDRKAVLVIQEGLDHSDVFFRIKAAEALTQISDRRSVPRLINTLRKYTTEPGNGGSQEVGAYRLLTANLIRALNASTGETFDAHDANIDRIIKESERWQESHKTAADPAVEK